MTRYRLDNGLLFLAYLSNILLPLGIVSYFAIRTYSNPDFEEGYFFLIPLSAFALISSLLVGRFKKVEFDEEYIFVSNVFGKEIDAFPVRNILEVKKMVFAFGGNSRMKSGKNYCIRYTNNNGLERKTRFMATIDGDAVRRFKKATAFLGDLGFRPE